MKKILIGQHPITTIAGALLGAAQAVLASMQAGEHRTFALILAGLTVLLGRLSKQ